VRLYLIVAVDFSIKSLNPCEAPEEIFNEPTFKCISFIDTVYFIVTYLFSFNFFDDKNFL
jgi:hypothetical protein